ncbi:MAG: hypothetical protein M3454_13780 [Actinomycetota bacterium]|nr:hypothetical protein [Actinomycetota bacterium]
MARLLLAGFLIAHGLIHAAIYAIPKDPDKPAPFDPSHSWAFAAVHVAERPARTFGVRVPWLTALLFAGAGIALLVHSSVWVSIAVCAAAIGLLLKGLFFHPWLILGVLIDIGVVWAATAGWPGSLT